MLQVQRFVNELMSSNCYILYDVLYDDCIVIDPGSEKCIQEQLFFHEKNLKAKMFDLALVQIHL